jgi:hypothetical protein
LDSFVGHWVSIGHWVAWRDGRGQE